MSDAATSPPERRARLVLVLPDGTLLGALPPLTVSTPWWNHAAPIVTAARERLGLDVIVLRLLEADSDGPGGTVTYLAEVQHPVPAEPWRGTLVDHPLRLPYARPGGPAADLAWARERLSPIGMEPEDQPEQIRTWNLSSIWRIPTADGSVWLKHVPPFFAHEGAMLEHLAGEPVPRLLAREGGRILLAPVPGEDLYEATEPQLAAMIDLLVSLQSRLIGSIDRLLALGLPDWRAEGLTAAIGDVVARGRSELTEDDAAILDAFVTELPDRFAAIADCGIPDTLVHGDFHPGNLRGDRDGMTLLDWGDCGVGHPLLDQAAFLDRVPQASPARLAQHWTELWQEAVPGSDPVRAAALLAPVAAARQAVIYRNFLDNIEPDERRYHAADPRTWLLRTAQLFQH